MDAIEPFWPNGVPPGFTVYGSGGARKIRWHAVARLARMLLDQRGNAESYRAFLARLEPLRARDDAGWAAPPVDWWERLDAIEADILVRLRRPRAAQEELSRRSTERAGKIAELSAAFDHLRPKAKRPEWIAEKMGCSVSTVEKALARLRRQIEA